MRRASAEPTPEGLVIDVRARVLGAEPLANPAVLRGTALYLSTYAPGLSVPSACWAGVVPLPAAPPEDGSAPDSQFLVRFSEPMSPSSVDPFETLRLARGDASIPVVATNIVVAEAVGSSDLRTFTCGRSCRWRRASAANTTSTSSAARKVSATWPGNELAGAPGSLDFALDPAEDPPPRTATS